jgi:tRNA1(Val) A37 N6-methylase TrmN6
VYPAVELATLLETLRAARLEPKRLCFVHATVDSPARVALVEALPAKRGGLVTSPPFVERENGAPSAPLRALLAPRGP